MIIVVGAGGYLGSEIVKHLVARRYGVIAVDRHFSPRTYPRSKGVIIIPKDFNDIAQSLADEIVIVSSFPVGYKYNSLYMDKYLLEALTTIRNAFLSGESAIFLTSHHIYGNNPEALAWKIIETAIKSYGELTSKPYKIIRIHNICGRNEEERDGYISVCGKIKKYRKRHSTFPVYSTEHERYFPDVSYTAKAIVELMEDKKRYYDIVTDELIRVVDLVEEKGLEPWLVDDKVYNRLVRPNLHHTEPIVVKRAEI